MKKITKHLILAFFSLILLVSAVYISRIANNAEQSKNVGFGYPFAFVTQDVSDQNSFYFPCYYKFELSRLKEAKISSIKLAESFVFIFLSLEILIFILEFIDFQIRKIIFKNKEKNIEI